MKIFRRIPILSSIYSYAICMYVTVQYVCCLTFICFVSFALSYVLTTRLIFLTIRFMFCMFCFIFCVKCFVLFCVLFLLMYNVVFSLFQYKFKNHCQRVETQLPLLNII